MDLTYFNPLSQSESDFLANFVARQSTLDFFLRQLRLDRPGEPSRHQLIVAPRGYGKTSLLRRIAIACRTEPDLRSRFIALTFREEQHNVISLDVFWRNCLQALLEAREDEGAPAEEIVQLDAAWEEYSPRQALKRSEQDGELVWQEFQRSCEQLKRRPLLLIDNVDALLAGLESNHQWALRRTLQSDDGPMLIAAASRYPGSTSDAKAPFYDFFRVQDLDKLSDPEVMHCLRTLAVNRHERGRGVLTLIEQDPGRIAALNVVAGGNPRTLNVLYGVLESHMSADVLSQLSAMLDTFTPWYQARTEEMPMQGRAVFDALALNWDPMTAASLGEATGLDTNGVSSQLSRLEKAGFVEAVSLSSRAKGRNGYQVSERLFNIWYLMRNGSRSRRNEVRFLTVFLQTVFSMAERDSLARSLLADEKFRPGYSLALAKTLRSSRLRNELIEYAQFQLHRLGQSDDYVSVIEEMRQGWNDQVSLEPLEPLEPSEPSEESEESEPSEPSEPFGRQYGQYGGTDADLREQIARALTEKAAELRRLGRLDEATRVSDDIVQRFGDATETNIRKIVVVALGLKAFWLKDAEQAVDVCNRVVEQFGEDSAPSIRAKVATVLLVKAQAHGRLGQAAKELEIYDALVEHLEGEDAEAFRIVVVSALVAKGMALGRAGFHAEAETVYRRAARSHIRDHALCNILGTFFLDVAGDATVALAMFKRGLSDTSPGRRRHALHANAAYALALHHGDRSEVLRHVTGALSGGAKSSAAGRLLLEALPGLRDSDGSPWAQLFEHLGNAIDSGDDGLWSAYLVELQRLLWYVVANGQGGACREWMDDRDYSRKYAPLYHAFVAADEGEDHLLRINPEVREAAGSIHEGIARMLSAYRKKRR
jgi:tetratricopeptide (TPR) repeat protein